MCGSPTACDSLGRCTSASLPLSVLRLQCIRYSWCFLGHPVVSCKTSFASLTLLASLPAGVFPWQAEGTLVQAAVPQAAAALPFPASQLPQPLLLPNVAAVPQHLTSAAADVSAAAGAADHATSEAASGFVAAQKQTLEGTVAHAQTAASEAESKVEGAMADAGSAVAGIPGDAAGLAASGLNRLAAGELRAAGATEAAAAALDAQQHLGEGVASAVGQHADKHQLGAGAIGASQASTVHSSVAKAAGDQRVPSNILMLPSTAGAAAGSSVQTRLMLLPQEASLPNPLGTSGRRLLGQVSTSCPRVNCQCLCTTWMAEVHGYEC